MLDGSIVNQMGKSKLLLSCFIIVHAFATCFVTAYVYGNPSISLILHPYCVSPPYIPLRIAYHLPSPAYISMPRQHHILYVLYLYCLPPPCHLHVPLVCIIYRCLFIDASRLRTSSLSHLHLFLVNLHFIFISTTIVIPPTTPLSRPYQFDFVYCISLPYLHHLYLTLRITCPLHLVAPLHQITKYIVYAVYCIHALYLLSAILHPVGTIPRVRSVSSGIAVSTTWSHCISIATHGRGDCNNS